MLLYREYRIHPVVRLRLTLLVFHNNSQAISFSCLDRQPCSGWCYALPEKKKKHTTATTTNILGSFVGSLIVIICYYCCNQVN